MRPNHAQAFAHLTVGYNSPVVQQDNDRRNFLRLAMCAAATTFAAPLIEQSSFIPTVSSPSSIEEIAARVFYGEPRGGLFVAHANPALLILRLLGAGAAIATIFDYLNIRPRYARNLDCTDAGGCTSNYQRQEGEMRPRGIEIFSSVHRSPENRDLSIMVGNHQRDRRLDEAVTQYHGQSAFNLRGRETEAVRAATEYLGRSNQLSGREFASAISVTGKRDLSIINPRNGQRATARMFDTALGGYILDHPRNPRFSGGSVAVHAPGLNDYDNPSIIGLRA